MFTMLHKNTFRHYASELNAYERRALLGEANVSHTHTNVIRKPGRIKRRVINGFKMKKQHKFDVLNYYYYLSL